MPITQTVRGDQRATVHNKGKSQPKPDNAAGWNDAAANTLISCRRTESRAADGRDGRRDGRREGRREGRTGGEEEEEEGSFRIE